MSDRGEEQFERIGRWWRQLPASDRQSLRANPDHLAPRHVAGLRQIGVLPACASSDKHDDADAPVGLPVAVHDYINGLDEE